jgi:hypothetical protein
MVAGGHGRDQCTLEMGGASDQTDYFAVHTTGGNDDPVKIDEVYKKSHLVTVSENDNFERKKGYLKQRKLMPTNKSTKCNNVLHTMWKMLQIADLILFWFPIK